MEENSVRFIKFCPSQTIFYQNYCVILLKNFFICVEIRNFQTEIIFFKSLNLKKCATIKKHHEEILFKNQQWLGQVWLCCHQWNCFHKHLIIKIIEK